MPAQTTAPYITSRERLQVLKDYKLLDTDPEHAFDRLTQLASKIIGAPVSLVSLVDADRQFFKSQIGLPEPTASDRQTPLSHSFCQHVVATNEPLIIKDAREVDFLKDNLAIPDLNVIAYLGMPLNASDGTGLGSFCVIDGQPRTWTDREIEIMRELAESVIVEMELRRAYQELHTKNQQMERIIEFVGSTLETLSECVDRGAEAEELRSILQTAESQQSKFKAS